MVFLHQDTIAQLHCHHIILIIIYLYIGHLTELIQEQIPLVQQVVRLLSGYADGKYLLVEVGQIDSYVIYFFYLYGYRGIDVLPQFYQLAVGVIKSVGQGHTSLGHHRTQRRAFSVY